MTPLGKAQLAMHSSLNSAWATPLVIVDACREALGGSIELDPASCPAANVGVGASRIYSPPQDGLALPWDAATVFCNPPSDKLSPDAAKRWYTKSSAVAWWRKALQEAYIAENCGACIFLAFSVELLQAAQSAGFEGPLSQRFSLCVPRRRIRFDAIDESGVRHAGLAPTHANLIVGISCDPSRFSRALRGVGEVRREAL